MTTRFLVLVWLQLFAGTFATSDDVAVIATNNNKIAAGKHSGERVQVHLEVREGRWFPDGKYSGSLIVQALGENGGPPQIPGPMIRVVEGTMLDVVVTNRIAKAVILYGLHSRPGDGNAHQTIAAGTSQEVRFLAGVPGTYYYWATTTGKSIADREAAESQLAGAYIVDPKGEAPHDRVFVIGLWPKCTPDQVNCFDVATINGLSWPFTERFSPNVGESLRWRWINPTNSAHAMHLHGSYYTIEAVGDGERENVYSVEQQRQVVTEHVVIGGTFRMLFTPHTAGNWVFHCHMTAHMMPHPETDADPKTAYSAGHVHGFPNDVGMGGLVLGLNVKAQNGVGSPMSTSGGEPRRLRLTVRPRPATARNFAGYSYDLAGEKETPDAELPVIGKPLVLTRGEPVEITIVNRLSQPTAVHWHGIELESYSDGVPGWSGNGSQITPAIAPGGSFAARFAPPRAGTFIYHTHWHDLEQLTGGLVGALIVLEPGEKYDSEHDKTFVFSRGGPDDLSDPFLINGSSQPPAIALRLGVSYHLRFINITPNNVGLIFELLDGATPVRWRAISKDGMSLPKEQVVEKEARQPAAVGETYDFDFTPTKTGILLLQSKIPGDGFVAGQLIRVLPPALTP
jgi:manganese oxidase